MPADKSTLVGDQNLMVCVRIRPISEEEILNGSNVIAHTVDDRVVVLLDPSEDPDDILRANRSRERQFVFDRAFDCNSTQEEVYESTTKFLIDTVTNGYNATVFAYGATGAGKTYTMLGTDREPGIMYRTLEDLFNQMQKTSDDSVYKFSMSYLEIYNEQLRDLLNPASGVLDMREDTRGGVQVAGLKEVRTGKLFLIDLAGSERAAHTQNRGKRMLEGAHINRSLLALGNCINALADRTGHRYVNFRDSKLTRLLKEALGGNCKTVMIANISPANLHFEDSRNTLVYADRPNRFVQKYAAMSPMQEIFRLRGRLEGGASTGTASKALFSAAKQRRVFNTTKEQILAAFQEVMELRKGVMSLDNTLGDLALEIGRANLLISQYEIDRVIKLPRSESATSDSPGTAPDTEAAAAASSVVEEPSEVAAARAELSVLQDERLRSEKMRFQAVVEMKAARDRARQLENSVRAKLTNEEEREILKLLSQLNALEMENAEVQAEAFLKSMEIRKRDLLLSRFRSHRQLCHAIISRQKRLLASMGARLPKSLARMHELYDSGPVDEDDAVFQRSMGISLPDLDQLESHARVLHQPQQQQHSTIATPQQPFDRLFHPRTAAVAAAASSSPSSQQPALATTGKPHHLPQLTASSLAWHNSGQMLAGYLSEDDLLSDRRSIWTDNTWLSKNNNNNNRSRLKHPGYQQQQQQRRRKKHRSLEPARVDLGLGLQQQQQQQQIQSSTRNKSLMIKEEPAVPAAPASQRKKRLVGVNSTKAKPAAAKGVRVQQHRGPRNTNGVSATGPGIQPNESMALTKDSSQVRGRQRSEGRLLPEIGVAGQAVTQRPS
uniref:Kinesin-like protein n=1 Tax=Macrostomum lignano TaxID=282301 RepID=A0A1I8IKU5_9PLAT